MRTGDTVVFTQAHYLWLVMVGKWPSKYIPRREFTGTVFARNSGLGRHGTAGIHWRDGKRTWHFMDNVEVKA